MQIVVRLGAGLAEDAGRSRLTVPLGDSATVADLKDSVLRQHPSLASRLSMAVAVSRGSHLESDTLLQPGDEVALLLPIAGGRSF